MGTHIHIPPIFFPSCKKKETLYNFVVIFKVGFWKLQYKREKETMTIILETLPNLLHFKGFLVSSQKTVHWLGYVNSSRCRSIHLG